MWWFDAGTRVSRAQRRVPGSARPERPLLRARWGGLFLLAACMIACALARVHSQSSERVAWIDGPLVGRAAEQGTDGLVASANGPLHQRVARLDRLLDLVDAARFGEDEHARETLWLAFGGHPTGIGPQATKDAVEQLLQGALGLEEQFASGSQVSDFLRDLITLLSVDLELPNTAEAMAIRTSAYRELARSGHPRIRDNAHWRLYDHVRGCLAGAASADPSHRMDIAVQALYVDREDLSIYLDDRAPHARPPWPQGSSLVALLARERRVLAGDPRWLPIVRERDVSDRELGDTLVASLPIPRSPDWKLTAWPRGTGTPESLAPVLVAVEGAVVVDPRDPHTGAMSPAQLGDRLGDRLEGVLAEDGRGGLLLALEPMLPSPELAALMRAAIAARVSRLEWAVWEPRVPPSDGKVLVVLPLEVAGPQDLGPGAQAIRDARVRFHLEGRGPRIAIDGRWLTTSPIDSPQLGRVLGMLRSAYPRERVLAITFAEDVVPLQVLEVLAAVVGGPEHRFAAAGWQVGASKPDTPRAEHDRILTRRATLGARSSLPRLVQKFPLRAEDQTRLEAFSKQLSACLPELELSPVPMGAIELELSFFEGRMTEVAPTIVRGSSAQGLARVAECVRQEATSFRLREHRDTVEVKLVFAHP